MTRQHQRVSGVSGNASGPRSMGTNRRLAVAGAAIALGVTAAWAVVGHETGTAEGAPPADARSVTAPGRELLHRASERLIAQCMTRHGFAYTEQPPPASTEADFPYVVDDIGWARKNGYGTLLGRPGAWDKDTNAPNLARLSPERQREWQRTLLGVGRQISVDLPDLGRISAPDNGCTAEARRTLYGDLAGWYRARRILDHFDSYLSGRVTQAPKYRAGLATWTVCVRKRGYAVSNPDELRRLVAPEAPETAGERAGAREIAVAVAEAECAVSTGFSRVVHALDRKYRPEIERRFARERDALNRYERGAAPRARHVLSNT